MEELRIVEQFLRFNRELTRQAYALMNHGGTERCGCSYCRNFAAQRGTVYPPSFQTLLERLGIDLSKEGEVYECGPVGEYRSYGGWLYFIGELGDAGKRIVCEDNSEFEYWFSEGRVLPPPEVTFGPKSARSKFLYQDSLGD
jgi:hypothetical protein